MDDSPHRPESSSRFPRDLPEPDWNGLRERCLSGDPDAWGELERALRPRILSLFTRLTGDPEAARDLFQAFLLRLCPEGGSGLTIFDPGRGVPLTAYLHVIAVRVYRSWRKSRQRREEERWVDLADWTPFLPARASDPGLRRRIERTLEAMAPLDRLALVLVASGFRHGEVATVLGVTPGGAAARIHRARNRFRQAFPSPEETREPGGTSSGLDRGRTDPSLARETDPPA